MRRFIMLVPLFIIVGVVLAGCISSVPETLADTSSARPASETVTSGTTIMPVSATIVSASPVAQTATPVPTQPPVRDSPQMETVANFTGLSGMASHNITIPSGYWELWYTADPIVTGGQDSHSSTGVNSAVFPSLSIQISDPQSGRIIETVEPPGGLDITLWQRAGDPRPWSQKFYNGNKEYHFVVTARHLKSYMIEVRIPRE